MKHSIDHVSAEMEEVGLSFEQLLKQIYLNASSDPLETPGIQLQVDSPQLSWSGAVGFTDRSHNTERVALTVNHPMRTASNTKTFIAAAILRLWEEGLVDLDGSIELYISSQHSELIQNKGYDLKSMTVSHLLTHTSGLFDYADSEAFSRQFHQQPRHRWNRTQQLQLAMSEGEPYGAVGEVYRYSDTGYILLGEIIERSFGRNLGIALRELLNYQNIGLNNTWLEKTETPPRQALPFVHQYDGALDSYALDASFDIYGGGGLVSTVGDLARFMRALFNGQIYRHDATLKAMLTTVEASHGGPSAYGEFSQIPGTYGMGIEVDKENNRYSHMGYFGTYAAYVPHLDMAIALSVNQHGGEVRLQLIEALVKHLSIAV